MVKISSAQFLVFKDKVGWPVPRFKTLAIRSSEASSLKYLDVLQALFTIANRAFEIPLLVEISDVLN